MNADDLQLYTARQAMRVDRGLFTSSLSARTARRFPPPWSVWILLQPLSERQRNVWMAAAIFSFSLHSLAKKISTKKLSLPA